MNAVQFGDLARRATLAGLVALATSAVSAATLEPGQTADFAIDLSGEGALSLNRYGYACNDPSVCFSGGPGQLAAGASLTFDIGSSRGASDYASLVYTQSSSFSGDAFNAPMGTTLDFPAAADTVFVRIGAVDDAFTVNSVVLSAFGVGVFRGSELPPEPVPVPPALPLGLSGLAALLIMRQSRRNAGGTAGRKACSI